MASIIVADENEGRRNLLAGTLEREGFSVTRTSTLRQTEGTALGTLPDVVLMDGEWRGSDPLDTAQRMMSDPEFSFKSRIVLLSRDTGRDMLVAAAKAGIAEVLAKPLDMSRLIKQLGKHARKEFVPPPADIAISTTGGLFDVDLKLDDPTWAIPMLQNLLGPDIINPEFVAAILAKLAEDGVAVEGIDISNLGTILRAAFGQILEQNIGGDGADELTEKLEDTTGDKKKGPKIGTSIEDMLQSQADELEAEILDKMEEILSEEIPEYAALEVQQRIGVDPEVVNMVREVSVLTQELLWEVGTPGRLNDLTLNTRVEDAVVMLDDVLKSLPDVPDEEE